MFSYNYSQLNVYIKIVLESNLLFKTNQWAVFCDLNVIVFNGIELSHIKDTSPIIIIQHNDDSRNIIKGYSYHTDSFWEHIFILSYI